MKLRIFLFFVLSVPAINLAQPLKMPAYQVSVRTNNFGGTGLSTTNLTVQDALNDVSASIGFVNTKVRSSFFFETLPVLLSDTSLTYVANQSSTVTTNQFISTTTENFSYQVAPSVATNHHITTAGGVKLYVVPVNGVYNIKAFGARGDEAIDDTAAIYAASLAIDAAGGGTLYFPRGTYTVSRISANISIGVALFNNMSLVGAGLNQAVIKGKPGGGTFHLVSTATTGLSNIVVSDITLDHNGVNIGASASVHGLRFSETKNVWITRVRVKNTDHHAILSVTSGSGDTSSVNNTFFVSDVHLENIGVSGRNGGDGIRLFYGADKITIQNVIAENIEYHGIHVGKGLGTVNNVQVLNSGNTGIEIQSEGVLLNNAHVEWNNVISDTLTNRPPPGVPGRIFWASDQVGNVFFRDNGISWQSLSGNLTGIWINRRDNTYNPASRISLSNLKLILNVTENTPFTPSVGDGVRVSGSKINLNNVNISGLFRFGLFTDGNTSDYLTVNNLLIEGCRSDKIRLDAINYPKLSNVSIVNPLVTTGTVYGINLRGTKNASIVSSYVDDNNLTSGIIETTTNVAENTKIIGCFVSKIFLDFSGTFNSHFFTTGLKNSSSGSATILSNDSSVVVSHGLTVTPPASSISIVPNSNPGTNYSFWVGAINSTNFSIFVSPLVNTNVGFNWSIRPVL